MVTTDLAQLSKECNAWRETLRSWRDEFGQLNSRLQEVAARHTNKDTLREVEHLHNQFHIQLINIHDLKQSVKSHERLVDAETRQQNGQLSDDALNEHEHLFNDYHELEQTLQDLRNEFSDFLGRSR